MKRETCILERYALSYIMTRKKDKNPLDEYRKIKDEMIVDKVNKIFHKHPDKYIQKMEEIGFEYHEEEDYEKIEEDNAAPQNDRQEYLGSTLMENTNYLKKRYEHSCRNTSQSIQIIL